MSKYAQYRVALAGPGGTGKTTIAHDWSAKHGAPLAQVTTASKRPDGINSHLDILGMAVNDPQTGIEFQSDLIKQRYELFRDFRIAGKGFISDRAVLDSYVYYSLHNSMFDTHENAKSLWAITKESIEETDMVVVLTSNLPEVDNNGDRVDSRPYQQMLRHVFSGCVTTLMSAQSASKVQSKMMYIQIGLEDKPDVHGMVLTDGFKCILHVPEIYGMHDPDDRLRLIELGLDTFEESKSLLSDFERKDCEAH